MRDGAGQPTSADSLLRRDRNVRTSGTSDARIEYTVPMLWSSLAIRWTF